MKRIAIVTGGFSSEYNISIESAKALSGFIDSELYRVYTVLIRKGSWSVKLPDGSRSEIDKNDFGFWANGRKIRFDYVYITIHGRPGEDGRLQAYFDLLDIPYSSCGVLTGALAFNKYIVNQFLKTQGVRVADSIRLQKYLYRGDFRSDTLYDFIADGRPFSEDEVVSRLGLPVFVKPNGGGSSYGITKVKATSQLLPAIEKAFEEDNEVIVERMIEGREVTCGCYQTYYRQVVFPITEIITENEFFDYNAKYKNESEEITPASLPDELTAAIQQETIRIYNLIGAKGLIRVDYIIPSDNLPVMLEINTNPGLTKASIIPQQIKAAGLDIKDVMTYLIEN